MFPEMVGELSTPRLHKQLWTTTVDQLSTQNVSSQFLCKTITRKIDSTCRIYSCSVTCIFTMEPEDLGAESSSSRIGQLRIEKINATVDYDEDRLHEMTASYSEISFDSQSSPPMSELRSLVESPEFDGDKLLEERMAIMEGVGHRPDRLNLKSSDESPDEDDVDPDLPSYQKALGYLQLEGTVMQEGDMVLFVAEDLETKIKLSSPVTKKGDTPSFPGSRSSTPCLYRQALTPQLPLLDHNVLNELEMEARKIATSVDALTENLAAILHGASAVTVGCLETYRDAVCKTCDAVDHNIKSMYQLMAKCEELSKSMSPLYKLADQIKEMKRMLELFESAMNL